MTSWDITELDITVLDIPVLDIPLFSIPLSDITALWTAMLGILMDTLEELKMEHRRSQQGRDGDEKCHGN